MNIFREFVLLILAVALGGVLATTIIFYFVDTKLDNCERMYRKPCQYRIMPDDVEYIPESPKYTV